MKKNLSELAIWGNSPIFENQIPVGQINLPSWEYFCDSFHDLFERRYYTNHGVLTQEFEEKLCRLLGTRYALVMTNATIALSLACKGLNLPVGGKVIVPSFTFAATVQALSWAGLEPVFCDITHHSHLITPDTVAPLLDTPGVCAILGVHLWGNACDADGLTKLAKERDISIFFDAAHAIGCTHRGFSIGGFGSCEVFSFHGTKILTSTEGGCITTNDDDLAERLRNLRSSYGRRMTVPIPIAGYGRFSEAQAAFGLLSLEDFPKNCAANEKRMHLYVEGLRAVPGIRFLLPTPGERHNYQYVVLEIEEKEFGLSRDALVRILEAENVLVRRYFVPGMHRCVPYKTQFPQYMNTLPVTDALCEKVMQVPSGQRVTDGDITVICDLIRFVHTHAKKLKGALPKREEPQQ
ncbi:aminotransferase class I/II-fold pyridoxal phosphate-dependent enzyme [Desulfobulbus sp.]|uniref:aminotransferase class I/II-fold pyridoxal phosphate-dependent enzyme n=1 Tax=Desulfobulbus sp. TaxID=895 RepID=UPI00286F1778|nr:aminotransferase class I/II-fold pyridoxal phosphate-dependent enzyme [Desulfobulbus sp.]